MEVASRSLFRTPQPHHHHHLHLAELRIEGAGADQSPVAFSDPCAVGHKRRCLFPAFSPSKKMLLELPPFSSTAAPEEVFSPAKTGGSGGSGGGAFAFLAASPKQPLTPMGSTSASALAPEPSLSPTPTGSNGGGGGGFAFLASPTPAGMIPNGGGGFAFFGSPEPERFAGDIARSGLPFLAPPKPPSAAAKESAIAGFSVTGDGGLVAPPYTISGLQTSASSPVKKPPGRSLWSRRLAHAAAAATEGRTIPHPPCDEQLHITLPPLPQKVPKTTLAPVRGGGAATLSASTTATPCCTFLTSPAKAKASNQEREARASRVAGDRGAATPAARCWW